MQGLGYHISFILLCGYGNEVFVLISDSFLYFTVHSGNGVLAIATLTIFSHQLSPAEYGFYALGLAIASLVSGVLYQWLNVAVGRFYPVKR